MQIFLEKPKFVFKESGGKVEEAKMPEGTPAYKITSRDQTDIIYTGEKGLGGAFAKGRYLVVPVYFDLPHAVECVLRFYENYGKDTSVHTRVNYGMLPGFTHYVTINMKTLDMEVLFHPRVLGSLKIMALKDPTRPEELDAFLFTIPPSATEYTVYVGHPYLTDKAPEQKIPTTPFVDKIGQWIQKDWKGKTKDEAEMIANYKKWLSEASEPDEGYKNSSGYFRTAVIDGMHYLLDPNGNPFFSVGFDCTRPNSEGPIKGLESLVEELPPKDGKFSVAWESERSWRIKKISDAGESFDFTLANLIKAFGDDWKQAWLKITTHRLKSWGFNTIANWSDRELLTYSGMPYVTETPFPDTEQKLFRDFPDVFSPEYEESAKECAKYLEEFKDDRNLIGYFLRNEPNFAFGDYNITSFLLKNEKDSYCKREFVKDMKEKYGDIASFNKAWGKDFKSFDDISTPWPWEFDITDEALAVMNEFNRKLFSRYIEVPAKACRAVAPNHLNLGLRWAWVANDSFFGGSEFVDVFSINLYDLVPLEDYITELSEKSGGKPVMIGEFHAGALDAGLPTTCIFSVSSQKDRGLFYSYYVEQSAAIPGLVGAHYFQYNDQPFLGRFDGENYTGMVDVCGKPHEELLKKMVETNARLLDIRSGKIPPTDVVPDVAPNEGFCSRIDGVRSN